MGKPTKSILGFIGLLLAYLLFWPVDAEPVAWTPSAAPEMNEQFELNNYLDYKRYPNLSNLEKIEYILPKNNVGIFISVPLII